MGKFKGGKFNGSHSTVVDGAQDLARDISQIPEIKKITLGMIQKAGGYAPLRMKVTDERAGAKLTIRAGTFTQEVYIYFDEENRQSVVAQLGALAPERHDHKRGGTGQRKREPVSAKNWRGD